MNLSRLKGTSLPLSMREYRGLTEKSKPVTPLIVGARFEDHFGPTKKCREAPLTSYSGTYNPISFRGKSWRGLQR
ncbi:hypothetical protein GWI33_006882 [Rhynchophorus ferrugineus]|uniref:Uncharacterized protein n=1 Tax=Rhynchophorus ferrugineus TaxID=354439 RepID=A0A834IF24_RHYFE|nr:hypothetical protein GWI33_006882 [Rhynchophorus ferrugineus]